MNPPPPPGGYRSDVACYLIGVDTCQLRCLLIEGPLLLIIDCALFCWIPLSTQPKAAAPKSSSEFIAEQTHTEVSDAQCLPRASMHFAVVSHHHTRR